MLHPHDPCLRQHATRIADIHEDAGQERFGLCEDCYRKLRQTLPPGWVRGVSPTEAERTMSETLASRLSIMILTGRVEYPA